MSRILVIDDEAEFCEFVKTALERSGHDVTASHSGADALSTLEMQTPDLILMDVKMPDVNGLELLPRIKEVARRSTVLVITAVNDYHIADLLYEVGADGYLTKPIRMNSLVEAVEKNLAAVS